MKDWNFDIIQAPRGQMIIAAGSKGHVTVSKWLPREERWQMFSKDTPPLAWMPWPTHPEAAE